MARPSKQVRDQLLSESRERLLKAAVLEFAREGYRGANINRISEAAGFAKGTVYNYFASKRALMLTVIDAIAAAHTTAIRTRVEKESDTSQQMEGFFCAGFAFVAQQPAQAQVIVNVIYGPDVELREHIYQAYDPLFNLIIHDILKTGIARGDLRPMDTDLITALIMSMYLGSCSQLDAPGKIWLKPRDVAHFVLDGLRRNDPGRTG